MSIGEKIESLLEDMQADVRDAIELQPENMSDLFFNRPSKYTKLILSLFRIEVACPECKGSGNIMEYRCYLDCEDCKGSGKISKPIEPGDVGRII